MYFHQLHGLRYGKTGCVEELCFHSSKTVPYWIVPIFRRLAFFGNPLKSDTWLFVFSIDLELSTFKQKVYGIYRYKQRKDE